MRLLEVVVAIAVAGKALAAPPVLDRIEVVGGQAPAVRLHLSGPAAAAARPLGASADAPHRIYVDLAGTTVAPSLTRLVAGAGPLLRVRAGQFDKTTARVVLDLSAALPFSVHQTDGTITIDLTTPAVAARSPAAPAPPAPPTVASARPPDVARAVPPPAPEAAPAPNAATPQDPAREASPPSPAVPSRAALAPPPTVPDARDAPDRAPTAAAETPPAAPAAPAERPAPPSDAPADVRSEPPPVPTEIPPRLPSLFPSMSVLPGALIALQNGRDLDRRVEHAPAAAPAPAPASDAPPTLAAAPPATPPPAVEPPASAAVGPEPTRIASASPPSADLAARPADTVPAQPARPRTPPATARKRAAPPEPHPLVVLDAGHGGRDPGAEGVGGILEKDVVLEVTRLVARRLASRLPVDVVMTRSDDSFIPIERRLALPGEGATLFISLHANACTDPSARGLEVFYGGGAVRAASTRGENGPAALLGRCLNRALQARIGGVRGSARPGGFGVLVRNPVPSALIEIGYLTHPGEAARAQDSGFHELLADAVVDGVAAFLRASAPPL